MGFTACMSESSGWTVGVRWQWPVMCNVTFHCVQKLVTFDGSTISHCTLCVCVCETLWMRGGGALVIQPGSTIQWTLLYA